MKFTIKQKTFKYSTCIMVIILFFCTIFAILGIRAAIHSYNQSIVTEYRNDSIETFDAILDQAIEMGEFGATNSAKKIEQDIDLQMDQEELKTIFDQNLPSTQFDNILRSSLQKNVYTRHDGMDKNRNSIFVILNSKLIASYAHYDSATSSIRMGYGVDVYDFVSKNFYNTESAYNALNKIMNQESGYIIWQRRNPNNSNIPIVNNITINDIHSIFLDYGLDGLKSFEFLIPTYITEYGDVFGNYDDHNIENKNKDKIIIVQKLNIVDYCNYNYPNLFESFSTDHLMDNYENLMIMLNIFIILECLSIISYAILFIGYYNHTILVDDMYDQLNNKKETNKNEETIGDGENSQ